MIPKVVLLVLLNFVNVSFVRSVVEKEDIERYTNLWAVQLSADEDTYSILEKLRIFEGFEIVQQEHKIPDLHLIIHRRHPRKGRYENKNLTNILLKYEKILWTEQISSKRIHLKSAECPGRSINRESNYKNVFNDEYFNSQWYLQDCRKRSSNIQLDLNVIPVWYHYKYFGYGIKVVVIDIGVQADHPDLKMNYNEKYSHDFVGRADAQLPKVYAQSESHGTAVAGIIAMQANNKICGVGIAPLVTLGALRILSMVASVNWHQRAVALSMHSNTLDVSSNSWGDSDDGKGLEPLNSMVMNAFKRGIITGRQSKGLIFVFASGNGRREGDTCAHDAVASSMYTITVTGAEYDGSISNFAEGCSNILVTVYSSDNPTTGLVSTYNKGQCKSELTGTSFAVPVVSGIVALILEANSALSWREVQHVFAWTNQVAALALNRTWFRNKAGFYFSLDFGFGLADAFQAVTFAKTMQSISAMNTCILTTKINNEVFSRTSALNISISTNGCRNLPSEVNYVEHVQLVASVKHRRRGAIQILLKSPSGTHSILMGSRRLDRSKQGLHHQIMDTVHFWGEPSQGQWSVMVSDTLSNSDRKGTVTKLDLIIHGTKDRPSHYANTRTYNDFGGQRR